MSSESSVPHAFRRLRRRLLSRRIAALDLRFRIELIALALLVGAFIFWQMRVAMDGVLRAGGVAEVARFLGIRLAVLVIMAGVVAGVRLFRIVRRTPPGPAWLSFPVPAAAVLGHLGWEARLATLVVAAGSPGFFVAAWGLLPALALLGMILLFALGLVASAYVGTVVAAWLALAPHRHGPGEPLTRALSAIRVERLRPLRPARWRAASPATALLRKDRLLAWRRPAIRGRLIPAMLGVAAAALVWQLPVPLDLARFAALALALLTAWQTADAVITLSGADPFIVLRALPVGALLMWVTRGSWALLLALAIVASQALALPEVSESARRLFLVWTGLACFGIVLLGVHYGITLFPRADAAARLLQLSLSLAMIVSLMIPLLGWIILLTAVIHSARRVPRWSRLEAVA